MPTGDRGGAQTKKLTPRQKRVLRAAVTKLQTAPATSEHSNGQSRIDRKPRTTSPKGTFAEVMARKQKPQQAAIGLNPADVTKLHALARSHSIGNLASKTVGELAQAAIYAPAGAYETGKAVAKDVGATKHGDLSFKRSRKIGIEIAKSTVEDLKHPLRHPGFTLMDASAVVSAGAGTAARLAAAGKALRAGEGIAKAAGRSSAKGGSLLHAPNPGRVTVREGGLKVQVPAFRNPAARAVQKTYHRSKDFKPGAKRVGKALAAERRVTEPLERAPAASLAAKGKRLTTPQEKALQVVSEGQPIDKRIALHQRDMASAKSPVARAKLRREIALLVGAKKYVKDVSGSPELRTDFKTPVLGGKYRTRRGAGPERLKAADAQYTKVDAQREKILVETGQLTPARIEGRLHGPGRVIAGAEYVKPTAARAGKPSASLLRARARVAHLQKAHDRATSSPPLDALLQKRHPKVEVHASESHDSITLSMIRTKDADRGTGAASKAMRDLVRYADAHHKTIALSPEPVGKGGLTKRDLTAWYRSHGFKSNTGKSKDFRFRETLIREPQGTQPRSHRADRLGAALSVAKDELAQAEKAAASRTTDTGLVGAEDFKGGTRYFPYRRTIAPKSHGKAQQWQGGKPKPLASVTHDFTGQAMRSTNYRNKTTQVAAEAGIEAQRFGATMRLRNRVIKAGRDVKPETGDFKPVRTDATFEKWEKAPSIQALQKKADEGVKLSRQEKLTLGKAGEAFASHVFPDEATLTSQKGITWVPAKLLDGLNDPHAQLSAMIGSRTVKTIDAINNATRAAVLYLKPAYAVPNVLGNAALNIVQQGFAAPGNLARAAHANAKLGEDAVAALDAGMGEGFAQALAGDTGLGTRAIQGLANTWSKGVDTPFRRSAFIYEARRLGYKSPAQIKALLLDDAHAADRLEAFQRANKEIIDYSRLGKREREIVRRVVFFYPWVKGSTMYAGHFAVEHPIKAAATVQLGRRGEAQAKKDLGPGPSYTDGEFKVNIPGRIGDMLGRKPGEPLVVNPASASILGTPAQVVLAAKALASGNFRKADKLTNFLTPAAGVANDLINNRDSFTDRPLKGNLGDKLKQELVGSLPQARLVDTLRHPGKGKLHPVTRTGALAKFGIGSIAPSPENLDARHELAYQEGSSNLSPGEKAYRSVFKERNQLHADAVDAGLIGPHDKLPEPLRTAYNLKAEREAAWDTASHGKSPGSPEYQFARYQADVRFLVKHGQLDKNEVKDAVAWGNANKADIEALKNKRRWITDTYYQPGFLNEINTRKHELAAAKG